MRRKLLAMLVGVTALGTAAPVAAHHSFAAEFDANAPFELTGTVTKIEWANPHTFFYIDLQNAEGEYENWAMEMGSPNGLMRRGWTRDTLAVGDDAVLVDPVARDVRAQVRARRDADGFGRAHVRHLDERTRPRVALAEEQEVVRVVPREHGQVRLHVAGAEPGGDAGQLAGADVGTDLARMSTVDRHTRILPRSPQARPDVRVDQDVRLLAS